MALPWRRRRAQQPLARALARAAAFAALVVGVAGVTAPPRVVIVGAGIGGLASAARLQKAGASCTIIEKNDNAGLGGRVSTSTVQGYRFDLGPTLMLLPEVYEETFRALGRDLTEFVDVLRVADPLYNVFYRDGTRISLNGQQESMREQLEALEPGSYTAYREYLGYAQLMLEVGLPNFIEEKPTFDRLQEFAWQAVVASPLTSHLAQLKRRFPTSPKLQALLSFQDLYVGLSPKEAPAVFALLQAIELNGGIYYPRGGFGGVAAALAAAAKDLGVAFRYGAEVAEIMVDNGGRARAVRLSSGEEVSADCIIVNADLPYAEATLLPLPWRRSGISGGAGSGGSSDSSSGSSSGSSRGSSGGSSGAVLRAQSAYKYSSSAVAFYWGCNRRWPQLAHHNVFLSEEESSWDGIFSPYDDDTAASTTGSAGSSAAAVAAAPAARDGEAGSGSLPKEFNFYVAAASRTDPTACPAGGDALTVLVPCATLGDAVRAGDAAGAVAIVEQARRRVIERFEQDAGMRGFGDSIAVERVRSPFDWRQEYHLQRGAVFGLAHGLEQLSVLRPRQRHPVVKRLWFCGASTKPGNGVPLVLVGARQVADGVARELRLPGLGTTGLSWPRGKR